MMQLSLFSPKFNDRVRHITDEGVEVYSLVDMMTEFSDTESAARKFWNDTKKRLIADGFQLSDSIRQLKMKAADGKSYKTDCADVPTCLRIIQSIPSSKAEPIRMWLASLGYERLEEYHNPGLGTQRAKERDLARLKELGYSNNEALERLQGRIDTMSTYKALMAKVSEVCDKPRYGDIVNAEYFALFGEINTTLQKILNTKSVRDSLPSLQLAALKYAESGLLALIKRQDQMTMDQILNCIDVIVRPLGEHLRVVCDVMGVHHITGVPLLEAGK